MKKSYQHILFLFITLLLFSRTAYSALELELTQGVDKAIPIALESFYGAHTVPGGKALIHIIQKDLQNSGRFRIINAGSRNPATPINLGYWQSKGVDALVTGQVNLQPDQSIKIEFKMYNTVGDRQAILSKSIVLANPDYERIAHRISDQIYEQLTGNQGIFSTKIAYVLIQRIKRRPPMYKLEVADADGHNPHTLVHSTAPLMSPAWSPDGKLLAYVSFENRRSSIYTVNVITGERQLVSRFSGINGAPAWSPDGKTLALVLSKTGAPKIYLLDIATGHLSRLTNGWAIDTEPHYSPDGRRLIFTSDRGGSPQIYQIDLRTKVTTRLTFEGGYNASAEFLSDGLEFVLLHKSGGMFNIAIQDLRSGQLRELTHFGNNESPSVSPNNQMVLYASKYGGVRVLNVVSVDSKIRMRLPSRDGEVQEPAWSPFIN